MALPRQWTPSAWLAPIVTRLKVAPSSNKNTASESPPSDCPWQAPDPLSYLVYACGGVNVVPAAIVIALLKELVVGGVGKTLVAVRRWMLIESRVNKISKKI